MFFILSKTISVATMPFTWLFVAIVLMVLAKRPALKRLYQLLSLAIIMFFGNQWVADTIMGRYEARAVKPAQLAGGPYTAIILSGVTKPALEPTDRVHLGHGADRIMHTVWLWRMGLVNKIVVTGGSGSLINRNVSEAGNIKKLLVISGVPQSIIVLEQKSRNTHENALFTKNLLSGQNINTGRLLLITSAYHMPRALACFAKQGLAPVAFPVEFKSGGALPFWLMVIPTADAFLQWHTLMHEWVGWATYRLVGYV